MSYRVTINNNDTQEIYVLPAVWGDTESNALDTAISHWKFYGYINNSTDWELISIWKVG